MRIYAQKPSQPEPGVSLHAGRIAPHTIGSQAAHGNVEGFKRSPSISATTGFGHDFSRIPVYSKSQLGLQAKLTVNAPGDIYEQEADRVAEQVTSMAEPRRRTCACGGGCSMCRNVQTVPVNLQANNTGEMAAPPIVQEALRSSSQPLDSSTREFIEPRFGHDFSHVRVHTDAQAAMSAQTVNALAYTAGRDIVFAPGQYAPETPSGRRLLVHELVHVVQQRGPHSVESPSSNVVAGINRKVSARALSNDDGIDPRCAQTMKEYIDQHWMKELEEKYKGKTCADYDEFKTDVLGKCDTIEIQVFGEGVDSYSCCARYITAFSGCGPLNPISNFGKQPTTPTHSDLRVIEDNHPQKFSLERRMFLRDGNRFDLSYTLALLPPGECQSA